MAGIRSGKLAASDLEPERPFSFLQSSTINADRLLKIDSQAFRTDDAQNASVSYVVRKVRHRRGSSFMRKRFVLSIMCEKGMPAIIMVTPLKEYQAWVKIRGYDQKQLNSLQAQYKENNGKNMREWPYKFSPREARSKIASASKFLSLMYLDKVSVSSTASNILQFTFVPCSDGEVRKPKEFEFRPEPFVQSDADAQCTEACRIVQCGALNMFLQKPVLVDRSAKPMQMGLWCEQVKQYVNTSNAYGKCNLHHHVQLEATGQASKVSSLLEWGADPNVVYGPTRMSALHMAASWHRHELVNLLLKHDADPCRADLNGLTPLHCAVIYGDLESVKALVNTRKFELSKRISTAKGELSLLDCALECEAPDHIVLSIWTYLQDCGAPNDVHPHQIYPTPFPTMKMSRMLSTVLVASRCRWQTRVSTEKELSTELSIGIEGSEDIRKLQIMLDAGMDANEQDDFGHNALCFCTSHQATQLLLGKGCSPHHNVSPSGLRAYAAAYTSVFFIGIVADRCDQLRRAKMELFNGHEPPMTEVAKRMGVILAQTRIDLQAAYIRAMCTGSPLLEALAEGKVAKAELLLEHGVSPSITLDGFPPKTIEITCLEPGNEHWNKYKKTFGSFYWEKLAVPVLKFRGPTALRVQAPFIQGSWLLRSKYAKAQAFKGLNLPQHKDMEARYAGLVNRLAANEPTNNEMRIQEDATAEDIASAERVVLQELQKLYQNPTTRLLEESAVKQTPSPASPPASPLRRQSSSDQDVAPVLSRVGSDYMSTLEGFSGFTFDNDADADEKQVAADVVKLEQVLRHSREDMLRNSIFEDEGWDAYRTRTQLISSYDGFEDEPDDC